MIHILFFAVLLFVRSSIYKLCHLFVPLLYVVLRCTQMNWSKAPKLVTLNQFWDIFLIPFWLLDTLYVHIYPHCLNTCLTSKPRISNFPADGWIFAWLPRTLMYVTSLADKWSISQLFCPESPDRVQNLPLNTNKVESWCRALPFYIQQDGVASMIQLRGDLLC